MWMIDVERLKNEKPIPPSSINEEGMTCMAWRITVESIRMYIPHSWRLSKPLVDELASQQKRMTGGHKTLGIVRNLELEMVAWRNTIIIREKMIVYFLHRGHPPRLRFNITLKPSTSPALYKPSRNRYRLVRGWLNA
jgi:hypothetical protein